MIKRYKQVKFPDSYPYVVFVQKQAFVNMKDTFRVFTLNHFFYSCEFYAFLFTPFNSEGQRSLPAIPLAQARRAGVFNRGGHYLFFSSLLRAFPP